MHRIIPAAARRLGRLAFFAILVPSLLGLPAATAVARGYFDGGVVLEDSPTAVANDGTVYALRFSAADVADPAGYLTPALLPNTAYHVKTRFTTNWQTGEPASTDNRGFLWNGDTGKWVFWDADWAEFPSVTTDASGSIPPGEWVAVKFSDTTKTGKYGLLVSLSVGGTGSTLNGRTWAVVDVYDPEESGGWVHAGIGTGAAALTPLRLFAHGTSVTPLSTAVTEANLCDDDLDGVVDDEQPGLVKAGGFRAGVPRGQALDASLGGVLWPSAGGFTLTVPDTDMALGAADQTAPGAPGALTAAPRNAKAVLTWPAAVDAQGVTGYRIYRWTAAPLGSSYTADVVPLATVGATTTYTDATAANGTTYSYLVRAIDAATNVGPRSPTASVTPDGTPPAAATSLLAVAGDGQVRLSWTNPADPDLAGVKLVRRTGPTAPAGPDDGTSVFRGPGTSFVDQGLTNGVTYSYAVFAYDTAENYASSGPSASATPRLTVKLTLRATPATVPWAGAWTFTGALTTGAGAPLPGPQVDLEQSTDEGATWERVLQITPAADTGAVSGSGPTLLQSTRFRLKYAGDAQYLEAVSAPVTVASRVALGKPSAPSRVGVKRPFKATGSLMPQLKSGITVKIKCYQLIRRAWKLKKTVGANLAVAGTASRYTAKLSLPVRGSWKLVAYVPGSARFAATTSGARKVTVR